MEDTSHMRRTPKIAAIAAGLVLAGAAAAAAVDAPPPAADVGLDVAEEKTGEELPVRSEGSPESTGGPETVDTPTAAEHGATVAATAHATESGPGKGQIVAGVASDGRAGGAAAPVDAPSGGGIDTARDASDGASAAGAAHASEHAAAGSGNAGAHAP